MDVALPKETYKRPGSEPPGQRKAASDTARQKQLRRALQKPAVLSEAGHETEARAQGVGVRTRMLDEAVHPDEYKIQKKTQRAISKITFTSL